MNQQAASSLLPLIVFLLALAYQIHQAYSRGKVEPTLPGSTPTTPPPSGPARQSSTLDGKSLEQIFQELGKGLEPPPVPAKQAPLPPPIVYGPRHVPQRPLLKETQSPDLQDDPAGLTTKGGAPLYETSVEKLRGPVGGQAPAIVTDDQTVVSAWLRVRLQNRTETQRAILLNEVLQPPVALRNFSPF